MKTLTWQEAYSNMILDDFVEDKHFKTKVI